MYSENHHASAAPRALAPAPWVVAGPAAALARLAPLVAAHRCIRPVVTLPDPPDDWIARSREHLPAGAAAVLAVGPGRLTPRRALPGLWLPDAAGGRVPAGWLPAVGEGLATYAAAAARALARAAAERAIVVLGQWEDRFLRVGLRTQRWMEKHDADTPTFLWTAERIGRSDMLSGLAHGPALAIYFGHGRPRGWPAYHGLRHDHFPKPWPEPVGALLTLCCENASRWRTSLSFAERLALAGVAGGILAAVTKTRHEDNRRWGPALCEAYTRHRPATLADLVARSELPPALRDGGPYRFIGDPLAPLAGATDSVRRLAEVFAPAPDDPLPAW